MGRDGWIGVGLLALSGWLYANLDKIPANPLVPIGPAFYPRILLLLIICLTLALIVQDLLAPRKEKHGVKFETLWKDYRGTLLSFFLFALYVLLLPRLGYLVSTILFVSSLQWLLGQLLWRRLPVSVLIGIGTSFVTYVVFEKYLHVFLPRASWLP